MPPSQASGVVLVRGDAFFIRRLDLPAGTSAQEVASFVALQLEELSPFPLDQLYHGYVTSTDRRAVIFYAAYRRRFAAEEAAGWAEAHFVMPEFAPALRLRFPATTVVLLRTNATLSALYFNADQELPLRVASRPLSPDAPPDEVEHVRQTLRQLVEAGSAREVALRVRSNPERRAKGLQFYLQPDGSGAGREIFIPGAECWALDVRDPGFVAEQRRRQGVDVVMWRVVFGAAAAIAVLLFGEILFGASRGYAGWLKGRNNARAPEVRAIQEREMAANSLEDFGRSGVQPFDMLTAVGAVIPEAVYFTRATAKGAVNLEIEGTARDIASINAYEAALKAVPHVTAVEARAVNSNVGGSTFRIAVTFDPEAFSSTVAQGQP